MWSGMLDCTHSLTEYNTSSSFIHSVLATCVNFAKMNNSMLRMCGHVSAGFRCVNTMVFVISLQVRKVIFFECTQHKICYLFKKFTLHTCNDLTKTIVFTLHE